MSNLQKIMKDILIILKSLSHKYIDEPILSKHIEYELSDIEAFGGLEELMIHLINMLGAIKKTTHADRTYAFSRLHSLLLGYHSKISNIDDLIKQYVDDVSNNLQKNKSAEK